MRICYSVLLSIFVVFCTHSVKAEQFVLPSQTIEIEEAAFEGNTQVREIIIPDGTLSIGDYAFSACRRLGWLTIPQSVISLGDAFIHDCADDLLIRTSPQSVACLYAQRNQIDYQAGTTYRALLIGQTYPDIPILRLNGPKNDVNAMQRCLEQFDDTAYQTTSRMNLTANEILEAISSVFADADAEDVSLLYYSGHGVSSNDSTSQGALLGSDGESYITASTLRSALDQISGRKIVIIDSCYSGNMLSSKLNVISFSKTAESTLSTEAFTDSFISAFSRRTRSGLAGDCYFVLTAAAKDEESFEGQIGNQIMGLFTSYLTKGCRYSTTQDDIRTLPADDNGNGVLTLQEIYQYVRASLIPEGQHAQVFPENCHWFGIFRFTP